MNEAVSAKLDAFRFCAAICVLAAHTSQLAYSGPGEGALVALGRLGVIAFFVLSGYVIAYVGEHKHADLNHFMIARLARLHSVFVPALCLTWIADLVGRNYDPGLYMNYPSPLAPRSLATLPAFLSFTYESFGVGLRWLSNGPLWSVAYEFWYYVLFGAAYFLRGTRRIVVVLLASLLAGYKVLLLLPLWVTGVLIFHARERLCRLPRSVALSSATCGLFAMVFLCHPIGFRALAPLRDFGTSTFGSNYSAFLAWDLVIAIPVCMIMVLVIRPTCDKPGPLLAVAKVLAAATFSVYCFHVPLLLLLRAIGAYRPDSPWSALAGAVLVLAACMVLSLATEAQKRSWVLLWTRLIGAGSPAGPHVRNSTV